MISAEPLPREIFFNYSKSRSLKLQGIERERSPERDLFFSLTTSSIAKLGDLGEAIALVYLSKNGFRVFNIGAGLFEMENEEIPEILLYSPAVEAYVKIDKWIHEYYDACCLCKDLNEVFCKLGARIYEKAKVMELDKKKECWSGHPGGLDFMAEKNGEISFFEVKVNNSQVNKWQKIRLLWLSQHGIPAKVIRIRINFSSISNQSAGKDILVKVPFKPNFEFGLIKEESKISANSYSITKISTTIFDYYRKKDVSINPEEKVYLIDLPGKHHTFSSVYPESVIEKVNYKVAIENVKNGRMRLPTEKEMKDITSIVKSYYHQEYGYDYGDGLACKFFNRKK